MLLHHQKPVQLPWSHVSPKHSPGGTTITLFPAAKPILMNLNGALQQKTSKAKNIEMKYGLFFSNLHTKLIGQTTM